MDGLGTDVTVWVKRVLLALLVVNAALLVFYVFRGYQDQFNSDAAVKNLIAGEIWRTGDFFPREWVHINGDLLVIFGHLFILPLVPFFPNGFTLHAVSGLISSALVLLSAWLLSGVATSSRLARILFVVILASGLSEVAAENLYGQVSYGTVVYMAGFAVFFSWAFLRGIGTRRWFSGIALALLTLFAYWANPQRAAASYSFPLVLATLVFMGMAWLRARSPRNEETRRGGWVLLTVLSAAVAGSLLHQWSLDGVLNAPGAGSARWLSFDDMLKNFGHTAHGLLAILGAVPVASGEVMSPSGLFQGARFLAGLLCLGLVPVALYRAIRSEDEGHRYVGVFAMVSTLVFVFLHITTTIPDMTDPVTTARYLVPSLVYCLLLLAVMVFSPGPLLGRSLAALVCCMLAVSAFFPTNPVSRGVVGAPEDARIKLLQVLAENDLQYGYATYWNAGALTVLSDGRTRVRQITLEQGLPAPRRHLSSLAWFRPSAWNGKTFLLLDQLEASHLNWDAMKAYLGAAPSVIKHGKYTIYVFPENIASRLPNWDQALSQPFIARFSEATPRTTGTYVSTPRGGSISSAPGEAGYLHFGPYLRLLPGRYEARIQVRAQGGGGRPLGMADITSGQSAVTHAAREIRDPAGQAMVIEFTLAQAVDDLELRVFTNGEGQIDLDGISLAAKR